MKFSLISEILFTCGLLSSCFKSHTKWSFESVFVIWHAVYAADFGEYCKLKPKFQYRPEQIFSCFKKAIAEYISDDFQKDFNL